MQGSPVRRAATGAVMLRTSPARHHRRRCLMLINRRVPKTVTCGPRGIGHGSVVYTPGCPEIGYYHRAWTYSGLPPIGPTPATCMYFITAIGVGRWATTVASIMVSGIRVPATWADVGSAMSFCTTVLPTT